MELAISLFAVALPITAAILTRPRPSLVSSREFAELKTEIGDRFGKLEARLDTVVMLLKS